MKSQVSRRNGLLWLLVSLGGAVGACVAFQTTRLRAASSSPLLKPVVDIPLPGSASRLDYQSFDPQNGQLYISHMGDDHLIVFDTRADRVLANLSGFPEVTGVLAVPALGRIYASAAGNHEVAVIDEKSLRVLARIGGIRFPDGLAYAPETHKVFVSDESGGADIVIDGRTNRKLASIPLGGEAGNTQYDPVSHRIFVAVQTRDQMVAIDPQADRIIGRYDLPGSDHPHGFYIDAPRRLMFVSCEGNAKLLVVDLRTMKVTSVQSVGEGPDVLAFDPDLRRLYVASESGVVSLFDEDGTALRKVGELYAPHAHTVAVVPVIRRVYLPLQNVGGRPVLRVMAEQKQGQRG